MEICHVQPPAMIFQCSSCRTVLSDSTLFACSVETLNILVVQGGTGIKIDPITQSCSLLSRTESDSAYMAVICECCGSAVGRLYTSVPSSLVQIAQKFCLDIATISSYKLGHTELRIAAEEDNALLTPAPTQTAQASEDNDALQLPTSQNQLHIAALEERIRSLESDMIKVQNMLLLHSEQLVQVPGHEHHAQ